MKKVHYVLGLVALSLFSCGKVQKDTSAPEKVIAAYLTYENDVTPELQWVTQINYAFGLVDTTTFDRIVILNEPRFASVANMKKDNPDVKILLSLGGWAAGGFSEMAADETKRKSFAQDCKRIVDEYGIDGIDVDWEYPSSSEAGISSSPNDIDNFTLLLKDIREAIGNDKMLTIATIADALYVDFPAVIDYLDMVNIMAYDVARPPYHHAPLYRSEYAGRITTDEAVKAHLNAGVPKEKLVLGIPLYGHGVDSLPDYTYYGDILNLKDYNFHWDEEAKVPYATDKNGKFVLCYEDTNSVAIKSEYVLENDLCGIMYWEYTLDAQDLPLVKTIYKTITKK
ncbi:MAG: glycoside hydrolase [Bacteroidales bacterium]|nr:glycoside hydrolase [Bacteroidales bacterium]